MLQMSRSYTPISFEQMTRNHLTIGLCFLGWGCLNSFKALKHPQHYILQSIRRRNRPVKCLET